MRQSESDFDKIQKIAVLQILILKMQIPKGGRLHCYCLGTCFYFKVWMVLLV